MVARQLRVLWGKAHRGAENCDLHHGDSSRDSHALDGEVHGKSLSTGNERNVRKGKDTHD